MGSIMDNNYYRGITWVSTLNNDLDYEDGLGCDVMITLANKIEALQLYCEGCDCVHSEYLGNRPKCCFDGDETPWCQYLTQELYENEQIVHDAFDKAYPKRLNNTDKVDHPTHYNRDGSMECIDEMIAVFGTDAVRYFCLLNVWKYRYRAADKNGIEDLKKSDWYMKKYEELCGDDRIPF